MTPTQDELEKRVDSIRQFNRAYAQKIGVFSEKIFDSPLSLTELRVLHELSLHRQTTATHLSKTLLLDGGYLSRILNKFEKDDVVIKERALNDARQRKISLTPKGKKMWGLASQKANQNILDMIEPLTVEQQGQLIAAMTTIAALLMME